MNGWLSNRSRPPLIDILNSSFAVAVGELARTVTTFTDRDAVIVPAHALGASSQHRHERSQQQHQAASLHDTHDDLRARAAAQGRYPRGMSQTVELPRPAGPDSELGGHWRVIVRNDDHNTFDHVAQTLARHIPGVSVDKGYAIADLIHNQGQAVVWSGQKEPAELYWELLNDSGLTMAPLEQG